MNVETSQMEAVSSSVRTILVASTAAAGKVMKFEWTTPISAGVSQIFM